MAEPIHLHPVDTDSGRSEPGGAHSDRFARLPEIVGASPKEVPAASRPQSRLPRRGDRNETDEGKAPNEVKEELIRSYDAALAKTIGNRSVAMGQDLKNYYQSNDVPYTLARRIDQLRAELLIRKSGNINSSQPTEWTDEKIADSVNHGRAAESRLGVLRQLVRENPRAKIQGIDPTSKAVRPIDRRLAKQMEIDRGSRQQTLPNLITRERTTKYEVDQLRRRAALLTEIKSDFSSATELARYTEAQNHLGELTGGRSRDDAIKKGSNGEGVGAIELMERLNTLVDDYHYLLKEKTAELTNISIRRQALEKK